MKACPVCKNTHFEQNSAEGYEVCTNCLEHRKITAPRRPQAVYTVRAYWWADEDVRALAGSIDTFKRMTAKKLSQLEVHGLVITKLYLNSDKTEYFNVLCGELHQVTEEEAF